MVISFSSRYECYNNYEEYPLAPDLILYGLIAAGLIFWLRSILGTRNGDERERPNPYLKAETDNNSESKLLQDSKKISSEQKISELAQNPKPTLSIESRNVELGLLEIARSDRSFDITYFAQAAQDVFVYVVESFADGDRETLKELLSPSVYEAFDSAIAQRENAGETMSAEISSVSKMELVSAAIQGRVATITVRFIAQERSYTKNKSGEIISGNPDKITLIRDIWTFSRETKSRDPRWLVVETREDLANESEKIPDTKAQSEPF